MYILSSMPTVFDAKTAQKHKALHSFCYRPKVRFEEQQVGEDVILVLRAHPVTQISWVVTAVLLLFVPLFVNLFTAPLLQISESLFVNFFWYASIFSYVLLNIIDWTFNVGIITNRRVIDINYNIIISREVAATTMQEIVDVTGSSSGFLPSIFNYGDVNIQTPGTNQNIEFLQTPRPSEVVAIVNQLMEDRII